MELIADRPINQQQYWPRFFEGKRKRSWHYRNGVLLKKITEAFHYPLEYQLLLEQIKTLSYFEQLEQVFLVEAGGREAGTVYPVRHSVEQKSWVEPFLWYAVCPFCRIFLQPEQETRTAVPGTEGSILLMPEDATAGWKPDDSCGAKQEKNTEKT